MKENIHVAQVDTVDIRISHLGFLRDARHFYKAEKEFKETEFTVVRYFLLGRSLELSFKSFLSYKNVEKCELKEAYGHDLNKLLRGSICHGFSNISDNDKALIRKISKFYGSKKFEYFSAYHAMKGYKEFPELIHFRHVCRRIMDEVERSVD